MKRRDFLKYTSFLAATSGLSSCAFLHKQIHDASCKTCINPFQKPEKTQSTVITPTASPEEEIVKGLVQDERAKSKYFSQDFVDDIFLSKEKYAIVKSLVSKFRIVQNYVGHGNFNLLSVDSFYMFTSTIPYCKAVTEIEKQYMEELFYFDAAKYGFKGDKTSTKLTDSISKREVAKVPFSGHFLKKENSLKLFQKVKKDVGKDLILTSGIRGVAKQFHLFLEKTIDTKGNISKASRSLAPPGYSFHYLGDFDVGKKNMGMRNFDQDFAETDEFKRLVDLGYINIRYTQSNTLGVRFEPWHLKV